jgi:transcriptional regulator with PAS, ATPase and Fis domain
MVLPDSRTIDELCAYHWPGNVRELQNIIKRIIFSEDTAKNISYLIDNSNVGYENAVDKKTKEINLQPRLSQILLAFLLPNWRHCVLKKPGKKLWIWLKKN